MQPYQTPAATDHQNTAPLVLVEYSYINESGTLVQGYAASGAYVSASTDTPANKPYDPILIEDVTYRRSCSWDLSQGISSAKGDIVLLLTDELEPLMYAKFYDQKITVLMGRANWKRSDFKVMMTGICGGSRTNNRKLILSFRDDGELLNKPFDLTTVNTSSGTQLIPLVIGDVWNVTPILINASTFTYKVSNLPILNIGAVYDNGVAITPSSVNLTAGEFTLSSSPAGQVTAYVQYSNDIDYSVIGQAIDAFGMAIHIFKKYVNSSINYVDSAVKTAYTAGTTTYGLMVEFDGYFIPDQNVTKLEVVNALLRTIGFFWMFTRAGDLQFKTVNFKSRFSADFYTPSATPVLLPSSIKYGSINLKQVVKGCTYASAKSERNWTVINTLAGVTDLFSRKKFGNDYYNNTTCAYTGSASTTSAPLGITAGTFTYPPLHASGWDAATKELQRRAHYHQYDKLIYELEIVAYPNLAAGDLLDFEVGDVVYIDYDYFGFYNATKYYTVLSINENINQGTAIIELMISKG